MPQKESPCASVSSWRVSDQCEIKLQDKSDMHECEMVAERSHLQGHIILGSQGSQWESNLGQ
eukprot:1900727-Amphidinium_carterae.1